MMFRARGQATAGSRVREGSRHSLCPGAHRPGALRAFSWGENERAEWPTRIGPSGGFLRGSIQVTIEICLEF